MIAALAYRVFCHRCKVQVFYDGLVWCAQMAVLFSGQGQPIDTDAAAILRTFQQRFAAVCAVLHSVVGGAGPTMQSAVNGAVNGLLCSCQAFLDDLKTEVQSLSMQQRY